VPELAFKIRNDFDELSAVAAATAQFLKTNNISSEVVFAANLAIEEIVTNTIKYAYSDTLQHEITIGLRLTTSTLEIEICDDGNAFDPFSQPDPDLGLPFGERKIGGLGIHLVRNTLDACTYARRDGRNIVRLTKKL
jgi:serine/threonine-protein kinase RsbW